MQKEKLSKINKSKPPLRYIINDGNLLSSTNKSSICSPIADNRYGDELKISLNLMRPESSQSDYIKYNNLNINDKFERPNSINYCLDGEKYNIHK